jgi:hypothetical protein
LAGRDGAVGAQGPQGIPGEKGEKGDKGDAGESPILSVQYPLKIDKERKHLSIDLSKIKPVGSAPVLYDGGGGLGEAFKFISVSGQAGLTAVQYDKETLTFLAGNGIALTTDPEENAITIGTNFFYQENAPSSPALNVGSRWLDSSTGREYVYIYNGDNFVWIEPTLNTISYSAVVHNTVSVTGDSYAASDTDFYIGVNAPNPVTVVLPTNPIAGREVIVKDESGHAGDGTNRQITIVGINGATIDNSTSAIINLNNACLHFIYRDGWRII